ncbi:MAG: hypothetical protein ACI31G_00225 [Bacilli bacterium]
MHKNKSNLLLILVSSLTSFTVNNASLNATSSSVSSGNYGPFYGGSDKTTIDITYKHQEGLVFAKAVIEIYSLPVKLEATYSNGYSEYISGTTYYFSFTVDINKYIVPNGVQVWFEVIEKDTDNLLFYDYETVYPATKHDSIRINNLTNYSYTSENYLFTFYTNILSNSKNKEIINFTNFVTNLFYKKEYGKVSFDSYIQYTFNQELYSGSEIYLSFDDKYNLFPNLKTVSNKKVIEFTIKRKSSTSTTYNIYLSPLYVNFDTYDMSYTARSGYVETSSFYFPINKRNEIESMFFQLYFSNFGASKSEYYYDGSFTFGKNHIGNCNNSTFCVEGEIGK